MRRDTQTLFGDRKEDWLPEEKKGDSVCTPDWVAKDMVKYLQPQGDILDPCKGNGVFLRHLPKTADWCEIKEGRDFFNWTEPVDWCISNPPYSKTRDWFRHTYAVASKFAYLVPLRNVFSGYGFLEEIDEYGGIRSIRVYGTGSSLNFPMGNAVGMIHAVRDYDGEAEMTFAA